MERKRHSIIVKLLQSRNFLNPILVEEVKRVVTEKFEFKGGSISWNFWKIAGQKDHWLVSRIFSKSSNLSIGTKMKNTMAVVTEMQELQYRKTKKFK